MNNLNTEFEITKRELVNEENKTSVAKAKFIKSIRNDFGQTMKKNPRQVKVIKLNWFQKISNLFKRLFSNF